MPASGAAKQSPSELVEKVMHALQASDVDRAAVLAEKALEAGAETPLLLNLAAYGLEKEGRLDAALLKLARAMEIAPRDISILTAAGGLLSKLGRDREALGYFENALALNPGHAPAHHGRGLVQTMIGDLEAAKQSYRRAVELDPRHPDAWGALAEMALADKDEANAKSLAMKACALDARQPAANTVLAQFELKEGDAPAAERRLRAVLSGSLTPLHGAAAEQLLGDALDAQDRPKDAFDAYLRANVLRRDAYRHLFESGKVETGLQMTQRVRAFLEGSTSGEWSAAGGKHASPVRTHVFLVGFVRSGTTLLEQVLASHPDVVALEEKPTLRAIATEFFDEPGGLERLRDLTADQADALRQDYWARVRSFDVDIEDKVFVDKEPMATLWLPLVAKLFPDAKILFAVRDPRDVVISAFKHRLRINKLGWSFTDLVETAEFYSNVMDLAARYREVMPLDVYQHRHEDLVQGFDAEVSRICGFLNIDPTDSMRNFADTAKRRDVRTPSVDQVRRGLFTEGMGRWRRYGEETDAILPVVDRWVKAYNYDPGLE